VHCADPSILHSIRSYCCKASLHNRMMSSSQELRPCNNPYCARPMANDYLCKGCRKPVHWFCALGNTFVNKVKGHGAHYWCPLKVTKKPGAVLQASKLKVQGKETTENAFKSTKDSGAGGKKSKSKGLGKGATTKKTPKTPTSDVHVTRSSPLRKKRKAVPSVTPGQFSERSMDNDDVFVFPGTMVNDNEDVRKFNRISSDDQKAKDRW